MNLAELIDTHRGGRSYPELSRACGGSPSDKRLQQLVRGDIKNFPDPPTVRALAKGLRVSQEAVLLAAAESLGLDVRSSLPRLVELLPADARRLSEQQAAAIAHLVRTIVDDLPAEEDPDADLEEWAPTVKDVLAAQRRAKQTGSGVEGERVAARTIAGRSRGQQRRDAIEGVGEESQGEAPEGGA